VTKQSDPSSKGASLYGSAVEYGLHCILWLIEPRPKPASSRDLAEFGGLSPALVAKVMPKLEKAGIVASIGGIGGGYRLARPAEDISVLDVVEAIDGAKSLFDCKNIRANCVLFAGSPPDWAVGRTCGIHAVMLRAERRMREEMAKTNIVQLATGANPPGEFGAKMSEWFDGRARDRDTVRVSAVRSRNRSRSTKAT
jgi:Rrf2 family protein